MVTVAAGAKVLVKFGDCMYYSGIISRVREIGGTGLLRMHIVYDDGDEEDADYPDPDIQVVTQRSSDTKRKREATTRKRKMCPHNRQRYSCKDCGGVGICQHNRERHFCKECGGSGLCSHNRQRYSCKDCRGS